MTLIEIDRKRILRNAHGLIRHKARHYPLWALIRDLCGTGSTSAIEICKECGWNPHQEASEPLPLL